MDPYAAFGLGMASCFAAGRAARFFGLDEYGDRLVYRLGRKTERLAQKWADKPRFHPLRCTVVTLGIVRDTFITVPLALALDGKGFRVRMVAAWRLRSSRMPAELVDAMREAAATHTDPDKPSYRALIRVYQGKPDLSHVTFVHTPKIRYIRHDQTTTAHLGGSELYMRPHKPNPAKQDARRRVELALENLTFPPEMHTFGVKLR